MRNINSNILFISGTPASKTNGAGQRTYLILKALREIGSVDLVYVVNKEFKINKQEVIAFSKNEFDIENVFLFKVSYFKFSSPHFFKPLNWILYKLQIFEKNFLFDKDYEEDQHLSKFIKNLISSKKYQYIVCRYFGPYLKAGCNKLHSVILDFDDLPLSKYSTKSGTVCQKIKNRILLLSTKRKIFNKINKSTFILSPNESENKYFKKFNFTYLPNIPLDSINQGYCKTYNTNSTKPIILTVGSMNYAPNIKGVFFFVEKVLPFILHEYPEAEYWIVGHGMSSEEKEKLESYNGVKVLGFISDLKGIYSLAWFSVIPIFEGGGSNIKTVESIFYGKPVLATPYASRGYNFISREDIILANDLNSFKAAALELIKNEPLRKVLVSNSSKRAEERYSYKVFPKTIKVVFDQLEENSIYSS